MPDTSKRVRIVTGHPGYPPDTPVVLVDGEPLRCVQRIQMDHSYTGELPAVQLTLIGVDVDFDMDAAPDYLVRVVGPSVASRERAAAMPKPTVDDGGQPHGA